jgi:dimethylhistidine N-methyltransferase
MTATALAEIITFHDEDPGQASLREAVLNGLAAQPKSIPPKFFYDQRGSELFDAICEVPEYYPTRTEIGLLQTHAHEIAGLIGPQCLLIELGSGASKKVRLLLEALKPSAYLGIDISRDFLLQSTRQLAADYPWLEVHAACADFSQELALPGLSAGGGRNKLAFFPGSSIGNFEPGEAITLLDRLADILGPGGALLIGVDVKKDPQILNAAYNDAQGITAAFNLNLLERVRNELDTTLNPADFYHQAFYNSEQGRIEMHLGSRRAQRVRVARHWFEFARDETIHTENSYKYWVLEFQSLAAQAGYQPIRVWLDQDELFSVHYLLLN